jgi:hypothetical protein
MVMKSSIFWDITRCSPLKVNQRFGETCRLHLQGLGISKARNQRKSRWQAELCWSFWQHVPPKRPLTFSGLHGAISQKIRHFTACFPRLSQWPQLLASLTLLPHQYAFMGYMNLKVLSYISLNSSISWPSHLPRVSVFSKAFRFRTSTLVY